MEERDYDAVVIGDGQSGGPLSTALAGAGRSIAVVESLYAGGTCVNRGCTPTKTMIASARVAYLARRAGEYGVELDFRSVDERVVRQRKRSVVESFREGSYQAVVNGGVDFIHGEARFTGPQSVEVARDGEGPLRLNATTIFINTGTRPTVPPIPGLDVVPYLDSTSIMELDGVPDHLIILGGGYIGLEFGQMFRRLGSRVTVVERMDRLMAREDEDIASAATAILREDGIAILLNTSVESAGGKDNAIEVMVRGPEGERGISGTHLLVAVGRTPNTERLNLASAGVQADERGFVRVNERLETTVPGIYAMGDVAGTPQFTHMSYDDFRILRANLLQGGNRTTGDRLVPYTVFIDPQLGRVGVTEAEAHKQGRQIRVASMPMTNVARAIEVAETRGMVKAVVDAETGQILGVAVLGLEGGEIMAMFEIAMMGKVPYTTLRDGIFAHPTLAELMNTLFSEGNMQPR